MSKETRTSARRNPQTESNENEFEPCPPNQINFPPPRTPFSSIPDPSRFGNATPRLSVRFGKPHSEPNSAQSTPSRNTSRLSLGGGRLSSCAFVKETEFCVHVPHFDLKDDPSFWTDHNVQVRFLFLFYVSCVVYVTEVAFFRCWLEFDRWVIRRRFRKGMVGVWSRRVRKLWSGSVILKPDSPLII